jgi:outer membrane protein assembly factor BamB
MVFISTKTDASVNSPYKLQALNAKNGDVIWTTELISNKSHMKYEVFNVAFNNKQLFVEGNLGGMVINLKDGKIVSKLNL